MFFTKFPGTSQVTCFNQLISCGTDDWSRIQSCALCVGARGSYVVCLLPAFVYLITVWPFTASGGCALPLYFFRTVTWQVTCRFFNSGVTRHSEVDPVTPGVTWLSEVDPVTPGVTGQSEVAPVTPGVTGRSRDSWSYGSSANYPRNF